MGCASSINTVNSPKTLSYNQLVDLIIKENKFYKHLSRGVLFDAKKCIFKKFEFEANNINYYPNIMVKFINLKVNNLDKFYCKIKEGFIDEECSICFEKNNLKRLECCKSCFHDNCLRKWINISRNSNCPCCRSHIPKSLTIVINKCTICRNKIYHHNPISRILSRVCDNCI